MTRTADLKNFPLLDPPPWCQPEPWIWPGPRHARPGLLARAARRGGHLIALAVTIPLILAVPLARAYLSVRTAA